VSGTGPSSYSGQQGLSSDGNDGNLSMFTARQMLGRISTAKLVKVLKVTNNGGVEPVGRVDVQPMVNQMDGGGVVTEHGTVYDLPYFRLQGGQDAIICDPKVGDIGVAVICDRDSSAVKASKDIANPGSYRRFNLADGMYFGGFLNGTPDQYVRFFDTGDGSPGIEVHDRNGNDVLLNADGIKAVDKQNNTILMTSAGIKITDKNGNIFNMKAGTVELTTPLFKVIGAMEITGLVTGNTSGSGVGLTTHTHAQPNDSHGDTEAETNPPTPGT
jgi:hypothetical protein